jgi:hypothetical protein
MNDLLLDVRDAARSMRRNPWFTATVVAILALGIGANTAIFGLVNAVVIRPLPYPHSDTIASAGGEKQDPDMPKDELETRMQRHRIIAASDNAAHARRRATGTIPHLHQRDSS